MAVNGKDSASTHFGRQMRKERLAHGWSLREFSARSGIDIGHASRIENGKQPPSENVAKACDAVFPGRRGWFLEYYEESRSWVPAGFRSWAEYEDKATALRAWSPGVLHGLLQTEGYARALLETAPGATGEMVATRLKARMERQRRVVARDDPPATWFVVDELSLYRCVGSPGVMAGQLRHLTGVARRPNVTLQVLPAVAHPAGASGFIVTGTAAYAEHVAGGFTYSDPETVSSLLRLFNTIHSESYRASESLRLIERLAEAWTGGSPLTQTPTAGTA
jgi:transcriptional regulator with XRE-family HTH domain